MLNTYFVDLHIHIGRDMNDDVVKVTASPTLTLLNIVKEAKEKKGIDLVGIIDAQSPAVLKELSQLIENSRAYEKKDGGIEIDGMTVLLGSEIEVYDATCEGPFHVLCYFPTLRVMHHFSQWLQQYIHNVRLSTQRFYGTIKQLQNKVKELEGIFIPAHVFTPFKSLYGKGVRASLTEVLNPTKIDAIELGLSADTEMADAISELHRFTFVSNSDSHSLGKIAREYQVVQMKECSFKELIFALRKEHGRKIIANFGLNPKLGKYHSTVCQRCQKDVPYQTRTCPHCKTNSIVHGVYDRIQELKNSSETPKRPRYYYQVPLDYIPGIGPKTLQKLLDAFQTEMNIIHHVPYEDLTDVIHPKIAQAIIDMREGKQLIEAGGGGKYGRITFE